MADEPDEFDEVQRAMESSVSRDPEHQSIWDSDDAIQTLREERTITDETPEDMAKRLLAQAAPLAAGKIIHLAMNSSNDNTSLAASRYITDLALDPQSTTGKAMWEKLIGEVVSDAELHANTGASRSSGGES